MARSWQRVEEGFVIYESREDGCWIAHGIRSDQIGTGDSVVEALADAIRAVGQVVSLANEDPTIEPFRGAPARIRKMAERAAPLPGEIFEIAHKMATGEWPREWDPPAQRRLRQKRYRSQDVPIEQLV